MNLQVYAYNRSFEVQKAVRFLKERRVPFTEVDLNKHRPGLRELELFARQGGAQALINVGDAAVKSHPVAYTTDTARILEYLAENPRFLKTPIIREGQRVMIGFDEKLLLEWLKT